MAHSNQYRLYHSQNFLTDQQLVRRLLAETRINKDDTVVEIGPGKGIITRALAEQAGHVIAIEQDERLALQLARPGALPGNVTVLHDDALGAQMPVTPFRVFANIPFRNTAAIVGKLTTGTAPPRDSWLVMQKEAAERFTVGSTSTMQAVQLSPFFDIDIVHRFERHDFTPRPQVESVLTHFSRRSAPPFELRLIDRYQQLIDVMFNAWQSSLKDAVKARLPRLASEHALRTLRLAWNSKVSNVPPEQWAQLFMCLIELGDARVWRDIARHHSANEHHRDQLNRPTRTHTRRKG